MGCIVGKVILLVGISNSCWRS